MTKLVIIDGNAIMYRAFHAMPPFTTPKGDPIGAVHGLANMVLKIIQDLKPTSIVVAFDEKEKTFRHKELPTYQSQRPPMPSELSSQFEKARIFLKAAKIPVYSKPGFEADDVIGTISTKSKSDEVVIVTGDRDMLQLVTDKRNIKLYMPVAGLSNAKLFGEKETVERMGVVPNQITEYKALVGDASDNYFGVPGVGPKTAINLLEKYKTVKEIYKHLREIPEKLRIKLEKNKESAEQSLRLSTIIRDVPIEIDFQEMEKWNIADENVINLFGEFGFKTITERVKKLGKEIEEEKQGALF